MQITRAAAALVGLSVLSTPLLAAEPFTLIVVPDTQNYTDFQNINTQYNVGQMNWIVANRASMNIKFVMHLGDHQNPGNPYRTQAGNIYEPDLSRPIGTPAEVQDKIDGWNRADAAIDVLDAAGMPYSLVPGNHDYLDHNSKTEPYLYLKTFGPQRYLNSPKVDEKGQQTYGGASPSSPSFAWAGMNTFHRFEAGGYRFLNLALQYDPDDNDLAWAQKIINENPGVPTIVTTHAFVNTKGAANDYQHADIFNKLVKNNPQIVMTFNGHLTGAERVVGTNIAGQQVQQMLVDYQAAQLDAQLGGDYYRGGGVLRTVQINPDTNRVNIKDYSPIANRFLPANFTAPDNDGTMNSFASSFGFDLDLVDRFGLPNKAGITRSLSLRNGANGYTGNVDTFIDASDPDANFGSQPTAWVDGDRNNAGTGSPDAQGLIRFNNLFTTGNMPAGAQIEKAELVIHTDSLADSQSANTITLHRLLTGWTPTGAVWSTFDGMDPDGIEAILGGNDAVTPTVRDGYVTFDVTESLAAWSAGATNHGWVLLPGGGDGWLFDTSEAIELLDRPELNITYRVVPEPASSAIVCAAAGILALRRGRRRRQPISLPA